MENTASIARERLALLFDNGSFTELDALRMEKDEGAAVVCAHGYVDGLPVCAFAQSPDINNGALGKNAAGKIKRLYNLAAKTGTPVVGIYDSNGVYIDGTADALTVYGKLIAAANHLSGVVAQISVIAGVCAGSAALMASAADFVICTEKSELYLTPPFGTDAATAETAAKNGVAAAVCADDAAAMEKVKAILTLMPANNLAGAPVCEYTAPAAACTKEALAESIADADSLLPLYEAYGDTVKTALATLRGTAVGIISACGKDALTADDTAKIARFVRTCDAFSIPVITLMDTPGFACDTDAARNGSLRAMAQLCGAYAEATTVKIALITGEASGAAFSAMAGRGAGSDLVLAWDSATIAPMRPEAAVEFLWHDKLKGAADVNATRRTLAAEYSSTLASAEKAAQLGVVDTVISAAASRDALVAALDMLEGKRISRMPKKHSNIPF